MGTLIKVYNLCINANELRIGNKIYPLSDCAEVVEVTDIDEGGRIGTTAFFDGYKGTCDTSTESACGIPLTREWLELCGYEYSMSEKKWYKPCSLIGPIYFIWEGTYGIQGLGIHPGNKIKYLHQLQNLYFALTGEELTIKEPA